MKLLLLIAVLAMTGCATRQTCYAACVHRRAPQDGIVIVRELDGGLHALIDRRGRWIDPWTMKPYKRPVEMLCALRPADLESKEDR